METAALEGAYRRFIAVAREGGFRPPADRSAWPAEHLVAHVLANDRLLSAATAEILAGGAPSYDNTPATLEPYLAEIGRAAGDWDGLVATARQCGLELVMLARRLDGAAVDRPVQVRILDGGTVRVEGMVPWSGVLATQAEVHLPAHTEELEQLRA